MHALVHELPCGPVVDLESLLVAVGGAAQHRETDFPVLKVVAVTTVMHHSQSSGPATDRAFHHQPAPMNMLLAIGRTKGRAPRHLAEDRRHLEHGGKSQFQPFTLLLPVDAQTELQHRPTSVRHGMQHDPAVAEAILRLRNRSYGTAFNDHDAARFTLELAHNLTVAGMVCAP